MASASISQMDLSPEPDLHPLYPAPHQISPLLSPYSGLSPPQKIELVSHCLTRACVFADLSLLSFLLTDPNVQAYVDLGCRDDDELGLVALTILGFGSESERDIEREECVRMLIAEGADVTVADNEGWTPLHHASLLAPPTLVSHLLTHGCSPLTRTRRKLTALDIVTAHSMVPGREGVALILEEAMRGEGWSGGRMEEQRRLLEEKIKQNGKRRNLREGISKVLGIGTNWWGNLSLDFSEIDSSDDEEDDEEDPALYTPSADFSTMLVFSPPSLDHILHSLITNFPPSIRNSEPANALYMLARFACLTCDHTWLEDLIMGATDVIEETIFNRPDDLTHLTFWLYNTTLWLHLMRCDRDINEMCEILGSFALVEEVINSVFVFLIRFAERQIDQLLDSSFLDHSPLSSEFESVQFESEWSFLRSFGGKKKTATPPTSLLNNGPPSPGIQNSNSRPPSPSVQQIAMTPATPRGLSSLRHSLTRARAPSSATPLQSVFSDVPAPPSPKDITSFLTAFHSLLSMSGVNPAFITQLWSQVMYWTACEIFNRILTRKKYICRSRAVQIGMNLSILEEWVGSMGLPHGVESHFIAVRELLHWLQCLSSIDEFSNLVATIQTLKHLNPLQMRRAVRDYKYEVNEGRMTEECSQYLAQLQKDWERRRIKMGVEVLRRGFGDRERERDQDESVSSIANDTSGSSTHTPSISTVSSENSAQRNIDLLFDREREKSEWEPAKPPEVLGELLDSRYMLPLLFPSDPRMLSAFPGKVPTLGSDKRKSSQVGVQEEGRSASRASVGNRGPMEWRSRSKKIREVGVETLQWVDGVRSLHRWVRPLDADEDDEYRHLSYMEDDPRVLDTDREVEADTTSLHHASLTRIPTTRVAIRTGRTASPGPEEITPVDPRPPVDTSSHSPA